VRKLKIVYLRKESIEGFKQIYEEEFGEDVTEAEAVLGLRGVLVQGYVVD